mgnify:CR=1 FL=1
MPVLDINGVQVAFPHTPYPSQVNFMTMFTEAVQTSSNALLESPTGTGKTLCILCAALAYQLSVKQALGDENAKGPVVFYASRTHSQLQQVVRELKKTAYTPRMVVLGSRSEGAGCVNPWISKIPNSATQASLCNRMCAENRCEQRKQVSSAISEFQKLSLSERIMDLEDFGEFFATRHIRSASYKRIACPYYAARDLLPEAELVLLPYNYLLDFATSQSMTMNLRNAIIVIDEAHNIESFCCDIFSHEIASSEFSKARAEISELLEYIGQGKMSSSSKDTAGASLNRSKVSTMMNKLESLHKLFSTDQLDSYGKLSAPSGVLIEMLQSIEVYFLSINRA